MLVQDRETDVAPELVWCEPPECVLRYDSTGTPQQKFEVRMPGTNYGCGQYSQEKPEREAYGHLHPDIRFGPGEHATYTVLFLDACTDLRHFLGAKCPFQTLNYMHIAFAEACNGRILLEIHW